MTAITVTELPQPKATNYLEEGSTVWSWLTTTDHKRIGILYALSITVFFFIAGVAIGLVRLELLKPNGIFLTDDQYNRLFTLHGIVMVWFFLVPSIPTTLGNFLLPMMIGAKDVAFPRLNLMSWYLFTIAGVFAIYTIWAGGVDTGWTFYTPFSTLYSNGHVIAACMAVFVVGFSSIATGLNFIVTTHMLRAPGMTWFRLPLMVWALYATSLVMVLATPVLAMSLLLIIAERLLGVPIFDPATGGDPLLFQHLFWFYSHPAVYIMILPAMGVISEVITCFARRRVFGYVGMVFSLMAIAVIGFMVWGHHMFVSGQSPYASLVFSFLSFMVAVPSAINVYNRTSTINRGQISFEAQMIYAIAYIGLFTVGGLTGLFLASVPIDIQAHATYFVIAHFHFIMVGGSVTGYFAGLHYWWPKITGKMYHERWARVAAITMFLGFMLTFMPQYIMGWMGMPRRYHHYPAVFQIWHVMSTGGAGVLAIAYVLPLIYLPLSLMRGARAPANPWHATGLEWQTPSPPPKENFEHQPIVTEGPYGYHPLAEPGEAQMDAAHQPQSEG